MCIDLTDVVTDTEGVLNVYWSDFDIVKDNGRALDVYWPDFDIVLDTGRILNVYWSDWHSYRQGKSFKCVFI